MAGMASYIGIEPRTGNANAALVRGVRVTTNSSGTLDVADATTRGDFVTLMAIEAALPGTVAAMGGGGKVPALASEASTVGALAYAAASGKFSVTSTNAALCGRWTVAASANNVLGEVELFEVA